MSAPITKSHMAFELPKLSYIDTSWEEPAGRPATVAPVDHGLATWISARFKGFRAWRARGQAVAELGSMSDKELADIGLNRGDVFRATDSHYNQDLMIRAHGF